jgi:hypothetical protein
MPQRIQVSVMSVIKFPSGNMPVELSAAQKAEIAMKDLEVLTAQASKYACSRIGITLSHRGYDSIEKTRRPSRTLGIWMQ